jgi:predicted MPP superfamily phosphohydrolase
MRVLRLLGRIVAAGLLVGLALLALMYWTAISDPVVRGARVMLPGWPAGVPPIRALLVSDIHVAGPDMPPARLARIVAQINALRPDIVLIAGDMVSDKRTATRFYGFDEAVAPLAALRPRLGTFAVMGNHDHERGGDVAHRALAAVHVRVIDNNAVAVGPLALGGLDDDYTGRADMAATMAALRRLPGARLMLSHSPDPFPKLPGDVGLMLAGHTHCGQIRLPFYGAVGNVSRFGERYNCGIKSERGHFLIVTAGIGTSAVPLRLGAVPDMWLIELGP